MTLQTVKFQMSSARRLALPLILLLLASFTEGAALQRSPSAEETGLRVELPASGELHIENRSGGVSIEVWEEPYIFIGAVMEGAVSRTAPVRLERKERVLAISVVGRAGAVSKRVDLKVSVPVRSRVEVSTASGEVQVHNLPSALSAQTTTGNIKLEIPLSSDADMTAESLHGQIVSSLDLDVPARSDGRTYQARLGSGSRSVRLRSESGQITLAPLVASGERTPSPRRQPPTLIGGEKGTTNANVPAPQSSDGPQEIDEGDIIRIDTNLVTLSFSVVERTSGRGFTGLTQRDFKLYEDGVEQQIAHFESTTAPFDLVLLMDLSGSTARVTDVIREAALRFIGAARPQDRISIITFASAMKIVSPLTSDRERLRVSVKTMEPPKGDTKLYDAVAFAIDQLAKESKDSRRRRAIVLMSDGLDSTLPNVTGVGSTISYEDLRRQVQEFEGLFYALWVNTEYYEALSPLDIQPETYDLAADRMQALAEAGGGVFYEVEAFEDLAGTYERVVEDLGTVYNLSYRPTNKVRDGRWRTIRVTLPRRPNAVARGKRGYYAN